MADSTMQARLLVVDDDLIIRLMLATQLRAAGYAVELAEDGAGGLQAARTSEPDLILTDWMMPRLDGSALIAALRADPVLQYSYIIVLSGRENPAEHRAALLQGADDYLVKPWTEETLLVRVRGGVRIRRIQQAAAEAERQGRVPPRGGMRADEVIGPLVAMSVAPPRDDHCGALSADG
jgi:DNA-binding response OmpR family regulator